jgi:hypothetical protein
VILNKVSVQPQEYYYQGYYSPSDLQDQREMDKVTPTL